MAEQRALILIQKCVLFSFHDGSILLFLALHNSLLVLYLYLFNCTDLTGSSSQNKLLNRRNSGLLFPSFFFFFFVHLSTHILNHFVSSSSSLLLLLLLLPLYLIGTWAKLIHLLSPQDAPEPPRIPLSTHAGPLVKSSKIRSRTKKHFFARFYFHLISPTN